MLDVDDWPLGPAPRREEAGDDALGVRVVPAAELRVVPATLDVNDEEGGVRGNHR
ncbi:MAG: hypothetical protein H0X52_09820 [Gemmatimonadetes bacterium]|nr:hypothetical protein [Gemmatimonadota bacterium]